MTISRNLSFLAEGVSSTGVLGATYGGTGQSSITTGDLLYGSASNTISKLAIGSTGTILRVVGGVPSWGTDYTGTVTSVAALTLGTTGTDLSSTVANGTTTPVITLNVPTASATNRGVLSSADWTTFNNKGSGSVTSVAASVPSFLSISGSPITTSGTLAITYSGTALPVANGGTGLVSLTAGYIPYGNGTSALSSSSNLYFDGSKFAVGTTTANSPITAKNPNVNADVSVYSIQGATNTSQLASWNINQNTDVVTIGTDYSGSFAFKVNSSEKVRIFNSGGVSIGNTTDPGAGNLRFNTTGTNGIYFGSSSILTDYETGTFTFTFTPATSGSITLNGSYQTGTYTKIGNVVTVTGEGYVSSVSSPIGVLRIGGLPYTIKNSNANFGGVSLYCEGLGSLGNTMFEGKINPNVTYLEVYYPQPSNPSGAANYIAAGSIVAFTATYFV